MFVCAQWPYLRLGNCFNVVLMSKGAMHTFPKGRACLKDKPASSFLASVYLGRRE